MSAPASIPSLPESFTVAAHGDPAIATYKVLHPTKLLLEEIWQSTVQGVQHELTALLKVHQQSAARWDDERRRLWSDLRRLESDRAKLQFELSAIRAQKIAIGQHASPSTTEVRHAVAQEYEGRMAGCQTFSLLHDR
jgi:hypothetical protein